MTLSFNLAPGASLGDAVDAIDARRGGARPAARASTRDFQGAAQAFSDSLASEPILILAALVTVYIVLGVLYESYIHPITILSTLPSAGVGALLALIVCGSEFSVIALIGIVLLIGIVKKNAIMMIDFALEAERDQGMTPARGDLPGVPAALPADHDDDDGGAARRRCRSRSGSGTGSELRRPLGITIVGGLLLSQMLTLYTTPVIYLYMERAAAWVRRSAACRERAAAPVGPERAARERRGRSRAGAPLGAVHPAADRDLAARGRAPARGRWRPSSQLPVAPLPRVDFPTIRCRRRCRARARRRWRPRSRRRSSAASGASPASPR